MEKARNRRSAATTALRRIFEWIKDAEWKSMRAMRHWICRSGQSAESIVVLMESVDNGRYSILGREMMVSF